MKFKVESGIPVAKKIANKSSHFTFPFNQMLPGQSFLYPCSVHKKYIARKLYNAIKVFVRHNPKIKFSVRTVPTGMRVWRIK